MNGTGDDFDTMLDSEDETPDSIFDGETSGVPGRAFASAPDDPFAPVDPGFERGGDSPFLAPEGGPGGTASGPG